MPDILLTHGYFLFEDEKEQQIMKPYAPLGLLYLSAYLKREGFEVEVFETTFSTKDALAARLAATPGGVVGVYTNLMTRANALWVVEEAHRHGWTVVLGGPESANYPEDYLSRGADVVVVGEGEVTMAELIPALRDRGKHRLHGVAGTVFIDEDGRSVRNDEREKVKDIVKAAFHSVVKRLQEMDAAHGDLVMTGGVAAHNPCLVKMFSEAYGRLVHVPPDPQLTGAFGAALLAMENNRTHKP